MHKALLKKIFLLLILYIYKYYTQRNVHGIIDVLLAVKLKITIIRDKISYLIYSDFFIVFDYFSISKK